MNRIEDETQPPTGAPDREPADGERKDGADVQQAIEERAKKDERTLNDGPMHADADR